MLPAEMKPLHHISNASVGINDGHCSSKFIWKCCHFFFFFSFGKLAIAPQQCLIRSRLLWFHSYFYHVSTLAKQNAIITVQLSR